MGRDVLLLISPVPPERFRGIARFAKDHAWHLAIGERGSPPHDWIGDGALVMLERRHGALMDAVASYRRRRIPVVDLTLACPEIGLPRVCGDNEAIGGLAADHFRERGFRKVAFFSSKRGNIQHLRHASFERRLGAKVPWLATARPVPLANSLKAAGKPLAVFCYSDYDATMVLNACRAAGISVPDEVSILGVDDNRILCENQSVPLSSVRHDHERVGYEGAALLERLMSGGGRRTPGGKPVAPPSLLIPPLGIAIRDSTDAMAAYDPAVRAAFSYIMENLAASFSAGDVARAVGMQPAALEAIFRAERGRSVTKEVILMRLNQAKFRLRATDDKLEAIASETGFCHASHLSNAFRAAFGVTPRQYRLDAARG